MTSKKLNKSASSEKNEEKGDKNISRIDITKLFYPVSDGFSPKYIFEIPNLSTPKTILFEDFLCSKPLKSLDLKHWVLSVDLFQIISTHCTALISITLDHTVNLNMDMFRLLRGHEALKKLSLSHIACTVNREMVEVIASLKHLIHLNLSNNTLESDIFNVVSTNCGALRSIVISNCKGLDDFSLYALGQTIERFRCLDFIDLSGSVGFSDEGVLVLLTAGRFHLREFNISNCLQLTNLSLTGLRNKIQYLRTLDLSSMHGGNISSFEYISEGCRNITSLNLGNSALLNDPALVIIGKHCKAIEKLYLNNCPAITDEGIVGYLAHYMDITDLITHGVLPECTLRYITLNNTVQIGSKAITCLGRRGINLQEIYLDGLAKPSPEALLEIFTHCKHIHTYSMTSTLSSTSKHRKSTIPHIDDSVLTKHKVFQLSSLCLSGACKITDAGMVAIVQHCPHLKNIDLNANHGVTDQTLAYLFKYNAVLETLDISGCVHITDQGMIIFCQGKYQSTLTTLQFNGCNKLTDKSMVYLSNFTKLSFLSMKSVDLVTNASLLQVFANLKQLTNVDIMNCDFLTLPVVYTLCKHNKQLQHLNIQKCSISLHEFYHNPKLQHILPFAVPYRTHFVPRPHCIQVYNKYVYHLLYLMPHVRKLQQLGHYICRNKWARVIKQQRRADLAKLQMLYNVWKSYINANRKRNKISNRLVAVYVIQQQIKRWYVYHQAKKRLFQLRCQRDSILRIQSVWRGHHVRKRYRVIFARYEHFTDKIGIVFYKYFIIWHKRDLKRMQIKLQSFFRMVPKRIIFWKIRYNIQPLQRRAKMLRRIKLHELRKQHLEKERQALHEVNCHRAAIIMQKNLKNKLFNYNMSKFILVCCIYYRTKYDEEMYFSQVIQKYYRGFHVRNSIYKAQALAELKEKSALRLQTCFRMYLARRDYLQALAKKKRTYRNLRYTFRFGRPRLRLGRYVKRIQRLARLYNFRCKLYRAATCIQSVYRGYRGRQHWLRLIDDVFALYVNKIKRAYHLHYCRLKRKERLRREYMAAFRIYLMVNKVFEVRRRFKQKAETERQARSELAITKKELVTKRREFFVGKIRDAYQNAQVMRIQRIYRQHKMRQREALRMLGEGSSRSLGSGDLSLSSISSLSKVPLGSKIWQKVSKPIRAVAQGVGKVKNVFKPQELIPEQDEKKLVNAVLTYQVRSILQEGLVDLYLTVGESELAIFAAQQKQYKNAHLPYFIMLPHDLTGYLTLDVFLWVLYGEGDQVICDLTLHPKPPFTSNAAMKLREQEMTGQGIKLIWSPNLHFELRGERSVRQGKAAFALQEITVADTPAENTRLALPSSHMTLLVDLGTVGIGGVTIWSKQRKVKGEEAEALFRFQKITAYTWFDERMERTIKSFNLEESDVLGVRRTFEDIVGGRNRDVVRFEDIFNFLILPYNQIGQWACQAIDPEHPKELNFSEYLHFVCYFVMLSSRDIARFLFQHADDEGKGFIRRDQFNALMHLIGEGGPFNVRAWELEYNNYYDKKLKNMFVKNFLSFTQNNQGVLWQPQKIQKQLIAKNLGKNYWAKKMEQYRVIRQNIGVKLM